MEKIVCNVKYDVDLSKIPDILEFILMKSGIKNTNKFINPSRADIHNPNLFKDMDRASNVIEGIVKEGKVGVVVDPDVDGLTSAAMIISFLRDNYNVEYEYFLPTDKKHGLDKIRMEKIKNSDLKYIVIPDASSSDIWQCKELKELGKTILILDHHKYSDEDIRKYATVINCKDGSYPNINLSGATVVQKLIDFYSATHGLNRDSRDKYLDLCSLGTIADNIDLSDPEARYYATEGLKKEYENNECIKEICLKTEYEMRLGKTIKNTSFNIAPNVNAVVRYGKPENLKKNEQSEIEILFRAMLGEQEDIEYQPRRKSKDDPKPEVEIHSLQKTAARLAFNAHSRQSKAVSVLVDKLIDKVDTSHKIVLVDATEDMEEQDKNSTGLIANKLMSHFGKPAFVLNGCGGSGRSNGIGRLANAHKFCNDSGFIKVEGHERAFGIKCIDRDSFLKYCDDNILDEELANANEVDFSIEASKLRQKDIDEIGKYLYIFGSTVANPTFFVHGIELTTDKVEGMSKEDSDYISSFSFKYEGIEFGKSYCKKTDYDEFTCRPSYGVIGKPKTRKIKVDLICEVHNRLTDEGDIVSSLRINKFYCEDLGVVDDGNKSKTQKAKKDNTKEVPFFF